MSSLLFSSSSSLLIPTPLLSSLRQSSLHTQISLLPNYYYNNSNNAHTLYSSFRSLCSSTDGQVSVVNFQDLLEKDWSFLESDHLNSPKQQTQKTNLIISEAEIDSNSRVLVSIPSEDFVDRLVDSTKCEVILVVHDSLFVLAGIKEKHDLVKCWQGELIYVPEKWGPFDVVFLCYLPALPFDLQQIFDTIAKRCSPGARLVISFSQGREVVDQQQKEYPDVVLSDLPHKQNLERVAADHSFEITKFVDEPGFYLAVLKFSGAVC
ncbi:hypothetical protein AQUCO_01400867v1 [Aquilegia coerulea]|uniref:Methyltransferase type 11 domain-containing protein n=1 Tax=Aquilegia coerulea TaxID=218851 RepID=A0A2G5DYG4_AQUCA|nr:hypothetical protein AQUCO_01400867v1 [Aquilegia coerulea]